MIERHSTYKGYPILKESIFHYKPVPYSCIAKKVYRHSYSAPTKDPRRILQAKTLKEIKALITQEGPENASAQTRKRRTA